MTDIAAIADLISRGRLVAAKDACEAQLKEGAAGELYRLLAQIEMRLGDRKRAYAAFQRALAIDPDDAVTLNDKGTFLAIMGQLEPALAAVDRACQVRPDFLAAQVNRANLLLDLARPAEVLERLNGITQPNAEIAFLRGRALEALGDEPRAAESYAETARLDPRHTGARLALADALRRENKNAEALAAFDAVLAIDPANALALQNSATLLHKLGRLVEAIDRYERLIAVSRARPTVPEAIDYALAMNVSCRREICAWDGLPEREAALKARVRRGNATLNPFLSLMIADDSAVHALCAERTWPQSVGIVRPAAIRPRGNDRIRIGYLSADFRDHPTGWLIANLIERHDRPRFEVFGYSAGPDDGSQPRARLTAAFDRFVDISAQTDEQAARRIAADGIDILVDLNGMTEGKRPGLLNLRPSPIVAHYLGYPGPLPPGVYDYFVADPVVIPSGDEPFYGAVGRLPGTYQANSYTSDRAVHRTTRADAGLPPDGFVFCAFAQPVKLSPPVFDVWMRILTRVPDSVLWLLDGGPVVAANLRSEAARRGVDPARLIFAPRANRSAHMARQALADLVLDTWPCGAHTSASDALWAGVPVITCPGRSFASRVASSLLRAADMPELIVPTLRDYEESAVALAHDPARLRAIKERLVKGRATSRLFDTDAARRELEAAYAIMWERHLGGQPPASFSV